MASRPARTVTAVLGIAVGVATVLAVLVIDHNTILTEMSRRSATAARADLEIRPLAAAREPLPDVPQELRADRDLADVGGVFFSRIRLLAAGAGAAHDLELVALDGDAGERFDAFAVAAGRSFAAADASEVLLPEALAAELGIAAGDEVRLQRAVPPVRECRDGELVLVAAERVESAPEPFRVVGLLEDRRLGRRRAALVPFARGLALFQGAHVQPLYWASLVDGAIYQDVRERLKGSYVVDKPRGALVGERVDQRAFRKSIRVTACLSLLLGLFVIYNAFSLALVERVREIGLLRALGFGAREITLAVVLEGAVLAAAGAVAGLLLAVAVVLLMKGLGITSLGHGKPLHLGDVPWLVVGAVLLAGALAAMLGMVLPLLRVRGLSVIEAVRAGRIAYRADPGRFTRLLLLALLPAGLFFVFTLATPPLGERQELVGEVVARVALIVAATFGVVLLFPALLSRAVLLVLGLLLRSRPVERPVALAATRGAQHRVFGSTMGIALVLAALFSIHAITRCLKDEAARFSDRALGNRVYVRSGLLPKAAVESASAAAGVVGFHSLSAEVHAPFPIRGVDAAAARAAIRELAADAALFADFAAGRTIVLSEFLAANHGYGVGDQVLLSTYANAYPVRVAAVSDRFGYYPDDRSFALLEARTFESLFCVDDAVGGQYVFDIDPSVDPEAAAAGIAALLPPGGIQSVRGSGAIRRYYLADMERDFWIFRVVLLMTALLSFVGLWNSLTVALLERRREIGLLRTVGFTTGQLGAMLAAESAALGLVGGVLAALAGAPVAAQLVAAIAIISRLDVRPATGGLELLAVPALAVALALLATVPPALRIRALVTASATRME